MARRIINKAYNDLVGGAGNDVASLGPLVGNEIPRKSSVLKLSSNDLRSSNRLAVEMRPTNGKLISKGPNQLQQQPKSENVMPEEKMGKVEFVNIDGDGSAKQLGAPPSEASPSTTYKMKSFMSCLEVGPRGHPRSSNLPNRNPVKTPVPRGEPDIPKAFHQEDPSKNAKTLLPIGINKTNQPYVLPKFMPTFREMMQPKPKCDPLVSIVEPTPPSMQKWAVEWNAEPKKTISIDELKEDLMREANAKIYEPPNKTQRMTPMNVSSPDEEKNDGKLDQPYQYMKNHSHHSDNHENGKQNYSPYTEPKEKIQPNVHESGCSPPWKDLDIPNSLEGEQLKEPEPQKIGRPLVDWVPPKYTSSNKKSPYGPQDKEYSFRDSINNGTPVKTGMSEPNHGNNVFFPRNNENSVYFDTEQQKFHDWFKERVSSAVQSTITRATKSNQLQSQNSVHSQNSALADPAKADSAMGNLGEKNRPSQMGYHSKNINQNHGRKDWKETGNNNKHIDQSIGGKDEKETGDNTKHFNKVRPLWEETGDHIKYFNKNNAGGNWEETINHFKHTNQNNRRNPRERLDMVPPEVQNNTKPTNYNSVSETVHEPENNSSFYHWLKSRSRHIVKNEPDPTANKKESEKTNQPRQNEPPNPQFPWSVSYTSLRKKVSSPKVMHRRSQVMSQNVQIPPKTVPQDNKTRKTGPQDVAGTLKQIKKSTKKSMNSFSRPVTRKGLHHASKKSRKAVDKGPARSASKQPVNSKSDISVQQNKNKKPTSSKSKMSVKQIKNKKTPKPEYPRQQTGGIAPSADHLWLGNGWNLSCEIDHVNNMRNMETFGHSPKGMNVKKLFPSLSGSQMKYWESKYVRNPVLPQKQRASEAVGGQDDSASPYIWFKSRMASGGNKNTDKGVSMVKQVESAIKPSENRNFSSIDEYPKFPTKVSQNTRDQVMDFSDDFDVEKFLFKEEAEEKKLLESTGGQNKNKVELEEDKEKEAQKVKGKEHIKFPRTLTSTETGEDLSQRVHQKLQEDDFILALGEDPGTQDLEWSEFIGPRNSFDHDSDLTMLLGSQTNHLSSLHNQCL